MITRTWPYGTKITGTVCTYHQTRRDSVVIIKGDDGEGYILCWANERRLMFING